jgi:hypothetical protein
VQRSNLLFLLFLISVPFLLTRCAKPVSPSGGPKDLTPPVVLECDPPNFSTRFAENSIQIDFDEFLNLKNAATEIFISPPLKKPLDARLKGTSLVVEIEDTLAANTTYSITFGNSIADLTEGNLLKGFNYVFSTGDFIDTLSLQGNLRAAFDLKPQKDVFIELYLNNNDTLPFDSLPLRVPPYYITKSDEQGNFIFHNLQNAHFKLFALADQNGDLIFNQPSEKIAFSDSLATPYYMELPKADSLKSDTFPLKLKKGAPLTIKRMDSLRKADSIRKIYLVRENFLKYPSYPLFQFLETDSVQRLVKSSFPLKELAMLVFRFPVKDLKVVPLNFDSVAPWHIEEYSMHRDSVRLWITKTDLDSLVAKIVVDNKIIDTVSLEMQKKDLSAKQLKKEKPKLGMTNSASSGLNHFKNKLTVTFSCPLTKWDFKRVLLISEKDTVHPEIHFADSLKRKITIVHKWQEDKNYKILIPDSVFFGIHDVSHDSMQMDFRTRGERDFGNLIISMNLDKRPGQYIIQLMSENESNVFEEHITAESGKVRFDFMNPGKYKLKAIIDRNRNRRWDTGNYKMNIQPEVVIYFQKTVEIRANWDVEESWDQ